MYKMHTYITDGDDQNVSINEFIHNPPPFSPEFTEEEVKDADKIEVWATSFNDEGPDYCEFRLMKKDQVISSKRVDGY